MTYRFKPLQELVWGVVIAGVVVILTGMLELNETTDLRTWGLALGVGAIRAMAGAALDWIRRSILDSTRPAPVIDGDALVAEQRQRKMEAGVSPALRRDREEA